ncbi:MBL fold metallo-hydrolase [Streptomyces abyssalis]|uniref:MBL fold metallo-hydrolase n=1 Tax=Streptomyces abyssalis TaxID=933944 RepID=A0A1E7JUT9_9ACTN|nr:MBL fold metallo-hydrolase [Streptomyces abyssalis]OEU89306.1 MBL fold metallo-hydrolase [Streptomyces abyssalis]OEU93721.1 MBL fold metallo-hydrolase [Streptomyces abyssalis]OEV06694.1 MBL fold metallo-hydrolase [Streptomyces nanshensis]
MEAGGSSEPPSPDPYEPGEPYTEQIAEGVHAYVQPDGGWCLNNAGWVSDGGAALLVDTAATHRRAAALRETLLESGAPAPSTVVNTHHHGDHTYGNALFTPRATVVGHEACRRETLAAGRQLHAIWPGVDFGDIEISAPSLTFRDELTLHTGGIEVRLLHPGVAHTTGDTVVWLPEQSVVFTGDIVFNHGTPFVPMGSLSGSLQALDRLRSLGARTVVPGHGPLAGPEVYDTVERYLRYVGELARAAHARGRTPLEAAREAQPGEFAELAENERLVANLHRAYAELEGRPHGEPLDMLAVWADMEQMNGGRPVACHA